MTLNKWEIPPEQFAESAATPRQTVLERIRELLNTPDGELLMAELRALYDHTGPYPAGPHDMAYKVGQKDVYLHLAQLKARDI